MAYYHPLKEDSNRVQLTAGGNLIIYPGEVTTHTAYLTMYKTLWSSIFRTAGAKYMCINIKNFYLCAPIT